MKIKYNIYIYIMSSTTILSNYTIKPAIGAISYFAIQKLVIGSNTTVRNLSLGSGAVAAGILAGQILGQYFPASTSVYPILGNLKGAEQRVAEISGSIAMSYLVNTVLLKNERAPSITLQSIAVFSAVDLIAELGCDFLMGRPLNFFDASN